MNVNRTEGCLWHARLPEQEKRQTGESILFIQLMTQVAPMLDGKTRKSVLSAQKQRYRMVGGSVAGLICDIETQEGKTFLTVQVPQRDLYRQLKHFSTWLNAGLQAAGHNVTLEVVYDADLF